MTTPNKLVSTHQVGQGVTFDCSEWAGESTANWSRGKFVSAHESGRGVALEMQPLSRLVVVVQMGSETNRDAVRQKLDDTASLLNIMGENLGHERFELDESQTGEREPGKFQYTLMTSANELTAKLAAITASLLKKQSPKNSVRVVVTSANETLCEIAA